MCLIFIPTHGVLMVFLSLLKAIPTKELPLKRKLLKNEETWPTKSVKPMKL
jgi:hypothetical protein